MWLKFKAESLNAKYSFFFCCCKIRQSPRPIYLNNLYLYKCNVQVYLNHDYHTLLVSQPAVLTSPWYSMNWYKWTFWLLYFIILLIPVSCGPNSLLNIVLITKHDAFKNTLIIRVSSKCAFSWSNLTKILHFLDFNHLGPNKQCLSLPV